jgi:DNA-binding response OmpR family regulator
VVYDRRTVTSDGPLILVVEDDASLRLVCRVNLELDGFRVEEAASVDEARAAAARERPALVLLDLWLGTEEAAALLDELRAAGLPVVLLSGADDADAYAGRATELMGKPFEPADLVAAAQRLTSGNVWRP